jgi:hypothetical protein
MSYTACRQDTERDIQPTRVSLIRVHGGLRYALCSELIAQTATCRIHIVLKDIPSCHLGRYLVASQVSSKRCSRMPLIGLVRLRWALEGETPSFDPIYSKAMAKGVGRRGNGAWQEMAKRPVI